MSAQSTGSAGLMAERITPETGCYPCTSLAYACGNPQTVPLVVFEVSMPGVGELKMTTRWLYKYIE